jgi:hypothetical protein
MIFGLKFSFTKTIQLLVLSNGLPQNNDISINKTILQLVLPSVDAPNPDI